MNEYLTKFLKSLNLDSVLHLSQDKLLRSGPRFTSLLEWRSSFILIVVLLAIEGETRLNLDRGTERLVLSYLKLLKTASKFTLFGHVIHSHVHTCTLALLVSIFLSCYDTSMHFATAIGSLMTEAVRFHPPECLSGRVTFRRYVELFIPDTYM